MIESDVMRKFAIIISIFVSLVTLAYLGLVFMFAGLDWYRDNNSRWITTAEGPCMDPTLKSGQPFELDSFKVPEEGDIISFSCFKKCIEGGTASNGEKILTKRLIKKEGDCFWVEGDNKGNSYDSRTFGWICKNQDIRVNGVVTAIGDKVLKPKMSFFGLLVSVIKHTF